MYLVNGGVFNWFQCEAFVALFGGHYDRGRVVIKEIWYTSWFYCYELTVKK